MKHQRISLSIAVAAVMSAATFVPAAYAIDIQAGDWKLSIDGNVNAHYIYSRCDTNPNSIAGGLATPITLTMMMLIAGDQRVMKRKILSPILLISGWVVTGAVTTAAAVFLFQIFLAKG